MLCLLYYGSRKHALLCLLSLSRTHFKNEEGLCYCVCCHSRIHTLRTRKVYVVFVVTLAHTKEGWKVRACFASWVKERGESTCSALVSYCGLKNEVNNLKSCALQNREMTLIYLLEKYVLDTFSHIFVDVHAHVTVELMTNAECLVKLLFRDPLLISANFPTE